MESYRFLNILPRQSSLEAKNPPKVARNLRSRPRDCILLGIQKDSFVGGGGGCFFLRNPLRLRGLRIRATLMLLTSSSGRMNTEVSRPSCRSKVLQRIETACFVRPCFDARSTWLGGLPDPRTMRSTSASSWMLRSVDSSIRFRMKKKNARRRSETASR